MRDFFAQYGEELVSKTIEHFYISVISLLITIVVAASLGILLSKTKRMVGVVLAIAGILQTVPILAILAPIISIFGIGRTSAIVAPFIYILLPILNNTVLGIQNIDKSIIEAGTNMGMTKLQLMKDVELLLALSLIIDGTCLSGVYVISWVTLANYIDAGGLGDLVSSGLNLYESPMITNTVILTTCLILLINFLLSLVEKWATPKGLKVSRQFKGKE